MCVIFGFSFVSEIGRNPAGISEEEERVLLLLLLLLFILLLLFLLLETVELSNEELFKL